MRAPGGGSSPSRWTTGDYDDVVIVALGNDAADRMVDGELVELGTPRHDERCSTTFLDELRGDRREPRRGDGAHAAPPAGRLAAAATSTGTATGSASCARRCSATPPDRPGVEVLDLYEQVCPAATATHPVDGFDPAWRPDGFHFNPEGARWVADWITAELIDVDVSTSSGNAAGRTVEP